MTEFKCNYDRPYQGPCPVIVDDPLARCKEHDKVCVSCGADATHDCSVTQVPLCSNCVYNRDRANLYAQLSKSGDAEKLEEWKRMPVYVPVNPSTAKSKLF